MQFFVIDASAVQFFVIDASAVQFFVIDASEVQFFVIDAFAVQFFVIDAFAVQFFVIDRFCIGVRCILKHITCSLLSPLLADSELGVLRILQSCLAWLPAVHMDHRAQFHGNTVTLRLGTEARWATKCS